MTAGALGSLLRTVTATIGARGDNSMRMGEIVNAPASASSESPDNAQAMAAKMRLAVRLMVSLVVVDIDGDGVAVGACGDIASLRRYDRTGPERCRRGPRCDGRGLVSLAGPGGRIRAPCGSVGTRRGGSIAAGLVKLVGDGAR